MKNGAPSDASVSQKGSTRTKKRCGVVIAYNRENGGSTAHCIAMMRKAQAASDEKTRVDENKSRADALRGAIDFAQPCASPESIR